MTRLLCLLLPALLTGCSTAPVPLKGRALLDASWVVPAPECWPIRSWYGDWYDVDGYGRSDRHRGLDFVAPRGTPVLAAADGRVISRGWQPAGGRVVLIWHGPDPDGNRLITAYAHLDQIDVDYGQSVQRGQTIGTVGTSGLNLSKLRTPHLHFEVMVYPHDKPRYWFGDWGPLRDFRSINPSPYLLQTPPSRPQAIKQSRGEQHSAVSPTVGGSPILGLPIACTKPNRESLPDFGQ